MKTFIPSLIVEWIPNDKLQNVKYLTKGEFRNVGLTVNGGYEEWDSEKQRLERFGTQKVVLKKLENVENAKQKWLEEVFSLRKF